MSNIVRLYQTPPDSDPRHWRDEALCREVDPELFFPSVGGSLTPAKKICAACDVRQACLDDALNAGDWEFGVRAGLAPDARQRILADRRRSGVAVVLAAAAA